MKTKRFLSALLCAALMLTLLPAESVRAADNTFTFGGVTITGDITADEIKYSSKHITLGKYGGWRTFKITLSGTAEAGVYISLEGGNIGYITLDNLHMTGSISVGDSSLAYFFLKGSNSLTEGGLSISFGAVVQIDQAPGEEEGFLYATGEEYYPGISVTSSYDDDEDKYYKGYLGIHGGTITAIGGRQAAGIGGSTYASGGSIGIDGGVVTAIGNRGAGIGGGNASGNGGEIYIYGGIVNAYSTEAGAGIGGGDDDSDGGTIDIAGGFINAVGAGNAAGIGGGNNGTSGNIKITGGTVVATGGSGGAGIGGGKRDNDDGGNVDTIRLYGGAIFASGKDGGEDVGKGAGGTSVGEISIADIPYTSTGIPTAVFLRNNTPAASGFTNIASEYSRVGPEDYAGISEYGIELSTLFPSSPPPIMSTLPAGVTPPPANWLENFWAGQRSLWSSATGIGAYLQLRSIHYYNTSQGPSEIVQSQHKGTTGQVLDGSIVSKTGYTFVTWKTSAGKAYNPGTDYTFNDSLDLYATWSPVVYDIGYNLAGGTVSPPNPTSYTIETPDFTLNNPTKAGYTFAGWSGTGITGDPVMTVTIPVNSTGARSYTANWTPNTYTVHYDANGGAGTMADTVHTYDLAAPLRENTFTYSGYSFAGWATAPGGDVVYSDKQSVKNLAQSGVVNLYAKWALSGYPITYDLDGGAATPANPGSYNIEDLPLTLTNPTKKGYYFAGWSGTGITGDPVMTVTIPVNSTGARSYTAHWAQTPPGYSLRTLTDSTTGISVSGVIRDDAVLTVNDMALGDDPACDAIRQRMNDDDYVLLLGKDISLSQDFIGTLTITIPLGAQHNGQTVTILHCVSGTLETYSATVANGKAVLSVTSLSPFAVFAQVSVTPPAPLCTRADVAAVIYGAPEGTPVKAWVGGTEQLTLYTAHDAFGRQAVLWTFYPPQSTDWTVRVEPQLPAGLADPRWQYRLVWIEPPPAGFVARQAAGTVTITRCSGTVLHFQLIDSGAP